MKLYLSSFRIPVPEELSKLIGKPLDGSSVALITNAKDFYSTRARDFKTGELITYLKALGMKVTTVDLREYHDTGKLKQTLGTCDLIWAMGGNTYMLRYEMRRSGFDTIIRDLLDTGVVYGGDSAGALVMGPSIAGVELADEPAFAEEVIKEGLGLVPFVILPHVDNPDFANVLPVMRNLHANMIELTDSQAVIFNDDTHRIVQAE